MAAGSFAHINDFDIIPPIFATQMHITDHLRFSLSHWVAVSPGARALSMLLAALIFNEI